jgi:hypothetical protein
MRDPTHHRTLRCNLWDKPAKCVSVQAIGLLKDLVLVVIPSEHDHCIPDNSCCMVTSSLRNGAEGSFSAPTHRPNVENVYKSVSLAPSNFVGVRCKATVGELLAGLKLLHP